MKSYIVNACLILSIFAVNALGCFATDKDEALKPYENTGCWWVEDKPENAMVGHNLGLRSVLIEHGHNMHFYHDNIPVMKNWRQLYELVTA